MRKILLIATVFLLTVSYLQAEEDWFTTNGPWKRLPSVNDSISQAVYISSFVNQITAANGQVLISTYAGYLRSVNIENPGTSSTLELFDTSMSTTATGRRQLCKIDSTGKVSFQYDVFYASGLAIVQSGATASAATIMFRKK